MMRPFDWPLAYALYSRHHARCITKEGKIMNTTSWPPTYTQRLTRRRFLGATAAGAGAAALIACGGGSSGGGGLKFTDSATAREPGTVWFASNDWKLEDETAQAVPGGVYPGQGCDQDD